MTIKPFAIQGSDLTLGGVNLSAGATTIVIPGVTQAVNYRAEEVERLNTIGGNNPDTFGSDANAITVIDNSRYLALTGTAPSGVYVAATYSVDELDDGRIEEVDVESVGTFAAADKTRVEAADMWATTTPTPFVSFNTANWTQIPYRPKMRAGVVENVGGGSGGVVERSIEFPAGESGDTAGTLALNPMGSLFICTADWTDVDDINKTFNGEAVRNFAASQSGFVYNFIELLVADHPGLETILNTLNAAGVDYQTDFTVNGGGDFGGAQTISQISFGNSGTEIVIGWPHRTGVDPTTIDQGDEFTVIYTGTVPQPAIWQQLNTGSPLGDLTIEFGNVITNGNGDVSIEADDDIRIDANDEVSIRTYGTGSGNYVEVVTGYDSNDQHQWKFDTDGNLTLPEGGDILDSNGNSVLGGGAGGDANIWVQTFASDAPATDQVQIATSVEYDADGNIFALFHHYVNNPPAASTTYTSVAKLSPTGAVLWQVRFNANINTDGWGLAYDGADTVYVAGSTDGTPLTYQFATLTKIDAVDGTIVWTKTYDFEADSQSSVVDVDSDLNPIMVGYAYNGTDNYIITTKVDSADGSVIWSRTLDGQNDDEAYGMAVGPTGEVVTIGDIGQLGTGVTDAAATLYTDPASNVNWTTGVNISGAGITCDVTFTDGVPTFTNIVDTAGNRTVDGTVATISGASFGGTSPTDDMILKVGTLAANDTDDRMVVIKYSSTGTIAWQKAIQFDVGYSCSGADADIDADGNIYVCGSYNTPIGSAMSLVKFDSSGVKQWSRRVVGDCADFATSVVVGPDNNLYLSGITSGPNAETFTWVVAKYSITGSVVWQRLIENTASWTFTGGLFFGNSGGSNIAVGTDYVALAGGFGNLGNGDDPTATVVQIDTNGTPFAIGNWAVTTASFAGNLNDTASDIVVVNAGKTTGTVTPTVADFVVTDDATTFLVGTLYTAPGGNDSLVNGAYSVSLGNTGTLTLPAGGTITEGYVTSNPTIQLTPASPDVASQKLVIKGGGSYNASDNGIGLNWYIIDPLVGDIVEITVNSLANADQTLYWWIYPEGAGIATPESGTVSLGEGGAGNFSFTVDSDDYEFTVRVSPEANNYDPATGVETQLFNSSAPTLDADHHLHLTTGNLAETSIFLGTDNHNVRTTVNGGIEITTPNTTDNVWRFGTDGTTTFPTLTVERGDDPSGTITGQTLLFGDSTQEAIISTPNGTVANTSSQRLVINPGEGYGGGEGGDIYLWAGRGGDASGSGGDIKIRGGQGGAAAAGFGGDGGYIRIEAGDAANTGGNAGFVEIRGGNAAGPEEFGGNIDIISGSGAAGNGDVMISTINHNWYFAADGRTTLPGAVIKSTVAKTGPILPTTTGVVNGLTHNSVLTGLTDNTYGPFTLGVVTFSVFVFGGVINSAQGISSTGTATVNDVLGTIDSGDIGGTAGTSITWTVDTVVQATPTAIDLTKSVNKLTDGAYTLANGVEGQIMYIVRQNGSTAANIFVEVASARWDGSVYSDQPVIPFQIPFTDMVTIIFTDGAWQASTFGSLT